MAVNEKKKKELTNIEKIYCMQELETLLKDKLKNIRYDDSYLERFLYGCDFNVDSAFNKMKGCNELNLEHPKWFPVESPLAKKIIIEKDIGILLPKQDKDGRSIFISKLGNIDTSSVGWFDIIAVNDIWFEYLLPSNPHITQYGLCVIVDIADISWKILKWLTPEYIKLSQKKLLTVPFKDFRFHFVNTSVVIHLAIKICWPLLHTSLKEMIKFHFDNWDSLYEHIDKEALPQEYGGIYNVKYIELYEQLYEKNEEVLKHMKFYRDL